MPFEQNKAIIEQFVEGINEGNLEIIGELVARDFYNYSPPAGEETAPEVLRELMSDLLVAFPDLHISVGDFVEDDNEIDHGLMFGATVSGTQTGEWWGAPALGNKGSWSSTVAARFETGKFSFSWPDLSLPSIIGTLREFGLVPPPEDMDKPTKYPISVPEFLLRVIFNGQAAPKPCSHIDLIQVTEPDKDVCEQCIASGDIWPALRMCLVCGFVGCCDTSKNKHMKQHYQETGHPIFRSIRLQEKWVWCYEDDALLSGKILDR